MWHCTVYTTFVYKLLVQVNNWPHCFNNDLYCFNNDPFVATPLLQQCNCCNSIVATMQTVVTPLLQQCIEEINLYTSLPIILGRLTFCIWVTGWNVWFDQFELVSVCRTVFGFSYMRVPKISYLIIYCLFTPVYKYWHSVHWKRHTCSINTCWTHVVRPIWIVGMWISVP